MKQLDYGFKQSNKMLNELEQRLHKEYTQAAKEMEEKANKYFQRFQKEDAKKADAYQKGEITKKDYAEWRQRKMLTGKRWADMKETLARHAVNTDKIAMSFVSDKIKDVYALNMNFGTYDIERVSGINTAFTLINQDAIKVLLKDNPQLLPSPKVDIPKDMRWNMQHINSAITQGIMQGESIPKVAKRLQAVTGMDERAAIRNARTAMTGAQNAGRFDAIKRMNERGVVVKKVWIAILDNVTRDSHVDLDGEVVDYDQTFSNGLMYPADGTGAPEEVYNCRCSLGKEYDKYRTDWSDMRNRRDDKIKDMGYEEWKKQARDRLESKIVAKFIQNAISSNKAKKSLNYIENRDSKLNYEKGAIIDANGDILKEYDGTEHAVEVANEDLQLMQNMTFTHNHPNGGFFSDNDIKTGFIKTHLGELRASTPQGIVYVLKDNNATLEDAQKYLAEYSQTSMRARRTAQEHFIRMIKSGDLSKDYYDKHYFELLQQYRDEKLIAMTKEKAKDFNFIFEVQKIEK